MAGGMSAREADELSPRVGLFREPFAIEIRKKEQPVGSRWRSTRQLYNPVVRILIFVKSAARPAHRITACVKDGKRSPPSRDAFNVGDYRIENRFRGHQCDERRRAGHIRSHPGPDDSGSK